MTLFETTPAPTRRDVRSAGRMRRRWRRVDRLLTAGLGASAVTTAICLGVTGPISSPVQPAAPVAAALAPQGGGSVLAPGGPRPGSADRRDADGRGDDRFRDRR